MKKNLVPILCLILAAASLVTALVRMNAAYQINYERRYSVGLAPEYEDNTIEESIYERGAKLGLAPHEFLAPYVTYLDTRYDYYAISEASTPKLLFRADFEPLLIDLNGDGEYEICPDQYHTLHERDGRRL